MPPKKINNYPDPDDLVQMFSRLGSVTAVAAALNIPRTSLVSHMQGVDGLGTAIKKQRTAQHDARVFSDRAIASDDPAEWGDLHGLLKRRGLNPDDWVITKARVNEWGDQQQLRVDLEPTANIVVPARTDGWKRPKAARASNPCGAKLIACFGDHHAPHYDKELHVAACAWLREHKPDKGILLGDLLDLDQLSRHRHDPENTASVQETVDTGYGILRSYIDASPTTEWKLIRGNHEDRLRNSIIDNLRATYGLTRAAGDGESRGEPVLSLAHLLRLDELDVEVVDEGGQYANTYIRLADNLAARHGWLIRRGAGASARATVEAVRHSVIIGHTHRQGISQVTVHAMDNEPQVLFGVEAGTMARTRHGLGYAIAPDWQQGFVTATIWPDESFSIDLATWSSGALRWRGERWAP